MPERTDFHGDVTFEKRATAQGPIEFGESFLVSSEEDFDEALSEISDGGSIYIGGGTVITGDKTISDNITIHGPTAVSGSEPEGVFRDCELTCDGRVEFSHVGFEDVDISFNRINSGLTACGTNPGCTIEINNNNSKVLGSVLETSEIIIASDYARVSNNYRATVTFEDGTSGGIAIGNTKSSITNNGDNEVPEGLNT